MGTKILAGNISFGGSLDRYGSATVFAQNPEHSRIDCLLHLHHDFVGTRDEADDHRRSPLRATERLGNVQGPVSSRSCAYQLRVV
jgi:hypothetical protein